VRPTRSRTCDGHLHRSTQPMTRSVPTTHLQHEQHAHADRPSPEPDHAASQRRSDPGETPIGHALAARHRPAPAPAHSCARPWRDRSSAQPGQDFHYVASPCQLCCHNSCRHRNRLATIDRRRGQFCQRTDRNSVALIPTSCVMAPPESREQRRYAPLFGGPPPDPRCRPLVAGAPDGCHETPCSPRSCGAVRRATVRAVLAARALRPPEARRSVPPAPAAEDDGHDGDTPRNATGPRSRSLRDLSCDCLERTNARLSTPGHIAPLRRAEVTSCEQGMSTGWPPGVVRTKGIPRAMGVREGRPGVLKPQRQSRGRRRASTHHRSLPGPGARVIPVARLEATSHVTDRGSPL